MDAITSEAFHQKFLDVESKAGDIVRAFRNEESVNIWPLLKRRYFADHHVFASAPPVYGHPLAPRHFNRTSRRLAPKVRQALAAIPEGQALVFTRKAVHVRKLGGRLYDPYLDPIIPSLADLGLLPVKLVIEDKSMSECHYPPLELPIVRQTSTVRSESLRSITGYKAYAHLSALTGAPIVPQALLHAEWTNVLSYSELFQDILEIMRPRIVIHEEFYNPVAMGLAHACRTLDVPCAEYQHGMQCNHIMYMFQHVPTKGFETIPKWFITWGPRPAEDLLARLGGQSFHRVCIGGKPENIAWARGDYAEERADLESLKERIGNKKAILVPLKLSVEGPALNALRRVILSTSEDWIWLLRQHPIIPSDELKLQPDSPAVETKLSTKLSLNSVLSVTDHVVSGISSVCLDAMFAHGIPVTLLGDNAAYYYREVMDPGLTTVANSQEAIFNSISTGSKHRWIQTNPGAYITSDTSLLAPALNHILGPRLTTSAEICASSVLNKELHD